MTFMKNGKKYIIMENMSSDITPVRYTYGKEGKQALPVLSGQKANAYYVSQSYAKELQDV